VPSLQNESPLYIATNDRVYLHTVVSKWGSLLITSMFRLIAEELSLTLVTVLLAIENSVHHRS
jgi:hypothetical protein